MRFLGLPRYRILFFRQSGLLCGTNLSSLGYRFGQGDFLVDRNFFDPKTGRSRLEHEIFDYLLNEIQAAEAFIIIDIFLWDSLVSDSDLNGNSRRLSKELANALIAKRIQNPSMPMLVLVDPVNFLYGRRSSNFYDRISNVGIPVVVTDVSKLPHSQRLYAPQADFWKNFVSVEPSDRGNEWMPNPIDIQGEKLSFEQLSNLLYFRSNQRKLLITDEATVHLDSLSRVLTPLIGVLITQILLFLSMDRWHGLRVNQSLRLRAGL